MTLMTYSLPYSDLSITSVFGVNPFVSETPTTNIFGVQYPLQRTLYLNLQAATLVASMVGGTVIDANSFAQFGFLLNSSGPSYVVQMPNGQTFNPALVVAAFSHMYPLPQINNMIQNIVSEVDPDVSITLTMSAAPVDNTNQGIAKALIGSSFVSNGATLYRAGPGAVMGVQGGQASSQMSGTTLVNPQPVNMWNGLIYTGDASLGEPVIKVMANVTINTLFTGFANGFWAPLGS